MQTILTEKILYRSKYSIVSLVENCCNIFLIKRIKKSLNKNVSSALLSINSKSKSICKVYSIEKCEEEYSTRIVMEYIKGRHIWGVLADEQDKQLISAVETASKELEKIQYDRNDFPDIITKTTEYIRMAGNRHIKAFGERLVQKWKEDAYDQEPMILCLHDLHRGNLIADEMGQWHIIDIDTIISATTTFMFSCLMAAGFLLEGYSAKWIKHQILSRYKKRQKRICLEIMIRLFWGYAFFSQQSENEDLFLKYQKAIREFRELYPVIEFTEF